MSKIIMAGIDLHDRSMLIQCACGLDAPQQRSFINDVEGRVELSVYLHQQAQEHQATGIMVVYEASGQGFGLCDLLWDQGIDCRVLSPHNLPHTSKGRKNKTDAKDAMMLLGVLRGHVLAGNELPEVWTPPQRVRDDRELVRARLEAGEALTQVKLKILTMLKRRGMELPKWFTKNRTWSKRFTRWLRETADSMDSVVAPVLGALVDRCEELHREKTELERHLRYLSKADRYKHAYQQIHAMKGVGLVTAMTFLTEMGDVNRFHNRRQVAAYLGLVPSARESGEADDRKGHITRQGSGRLRKVLCQAAWSAVRTDADVRQEWERIKGAGKRQGKKAIVAVMRKMAIKMWHIASSMGVTTTLMSRRDSLCIESPPGVPLSPGSSA